MARGSLSAGLPLTLAFPVMRPQIELPKTPPLEMILILDFCNLNDNKFYIKDCINTKFQDTWSNIATNTMLISIKPCIKPWPFVKTAVVRDIRVLNRLRIGHTYHRGQKSWVLRGWNSSIKIAQYKKRWCLVT